jgi:heat shock protein HslJ
MGSGLGKETRMDCRSIGAVARGVVGALVAGAAILTAMPVSAQDGFPFGRELLLDARPMKGSKRVPSLDIADNGMAEIGLWCNSVTAQLVVAGDTITVVTGTKTDRPCPPERLRGDDEILAALTEATNWQIQGQALVLTGARPLRFLFQTN